MILAVNLPGLARKEVSLDEELQRVIPIIKTIREISDIPISIDTKNARVMSEAVHAGASMINDVNALRGEGALAMAVELAVPVCLMHMQGQPDTMQKAPQYEDVVKEVKTYLQERINVCVKAGIKTSNLIIDPGIGFGKSVQHNLCLLKHLAEFNELGKPLLLGVSRKSMIGALLNNAPADERLYASVALATLAAWMDTGILRVHDVKATNDALTLCQAVKEAK